MRIFVPKRLVYLISINFVSPNIFLNPYTYGTRNVTHLNIYNYI